MKVGKETAKTIAKLGLGVLLLIYVLKSKMIDFDLLGSVLFNPMNFLIGMFFIFLSVVCCSARWYLLIKAQGLSLSLWNVISLTMIGNFFNTFMPGSVGGDLIKAWYVAGREPKRKTKAILTVLIDRIIGLAVIIFYAATAMLFYIRWLDLHHELQLVAYSLWTFTLVSVLGGIVFFTPTFWKVPLFRRIITRLERFGQLKKIVDGILLYRNHITTIIISILLSALSILGTNIFYYLQGRTLGIPLTLSQYFFIAPIALVVSAVPLLPGGIGTGQVAFFTLFQWMGLANPDLGGTLCTVVQIYTVIFNCFGAFFYLKFKRSPKPFPGVESLTLSQTG